MYDIVAIGEILIDFTPCGYTKEGAPRYACNPGGAPANVVVAASRLGLKTAFIGRVGKDYFGTMLRNVLEQNQVDTRELSVDPEIPTTLAIVSLDENGDRSFTFYRKPGADIRLIWENINKELLVSGSVVHFGSVALSSEPARSTVLKAVDYARNHQCIIAYDPNYRPALWNNESDAITLMKEGLKKSDILKISEEEMLLLTGTDDCDLGSQILSDYGITLVTVTLGERGAYYRVGKTTGYVPGHKTVVADTNGAGDTFLGALLVKLKSLNLSQIAALEPKTLHSYIEFANKAASISTTRPGAIPAMPTIEEIRD